MHFIQLILFSICIPQQVIHTIKSKHFSYNGLQTMSGASEAPIKVIQANRNARKMSFSSEEIQQIAATLSAIEEPGDNYG